MAELIARLDRSQFQVHVACFHRSGQWLSHVERAASSVTEFPLRSFHSASTVGASKAFVRWCREHRLALLQTCDLYANIFGLPLGAFARVPVRIGSRRELNPDKSAAQIAAQRTAYGFAHRVVANSTAAARRLRLEGVRPGTIVQIPNGIDLDRFRPVVESSRPARRLVTVARLRQEKGLEVLLDAMAILVRSHPHLALTMVGDGPMARDLANRVTALGLDHHVTLPGHTPHVAEALAAADLFVLPSRSEAFPNAVIEAMAMGLPIVATNVGGVPELIDHGRSGILVPPDQPEALAGAIADLLLRPVFARALGRAARETVLGRYSFDRMVHQFQNLYLDRLGHRAGAAPVPTRSQPVIS